MFSNLIFMSFCLVLTDFSFRMHRCETRHRWHLETIHARGDIVAADVSKSNLTLVPSEPPPRHATIENWPAEKSAQKVKAIDLADAAGLFTKLSH
jgi:hypothetical protein